MTHRLTTRPHLDHFRGQAKTLLAELRAGEAEAVAKFRAHLPTALGMSAAEVRAARFRLADAQSVIARQNGFASWPLLVRHVDHLRALEGEWHFEALQVDGNDMPAAMLGHSKLLMDGDRFRMESPEATYDGHFTIDASTTPMQIDIAFVEGPEAGHHSYGLFELEGDRLTICLGLVGASRPTSFATRPGSGHALERLRRASSAHPADVNGGVAPASRTTDVELPRRSADAPDAVTETSPMLDRLEGEWRPVRVVMGGKEMPPQWLQHGSRTGKGDEVKVIFGGQVMLHAQMRIDDNAMPVAIDYTNLHGPGIGMLSKGIMEWVGEEVRFLMAAPGQDRPTDFSSPSAAGLTFSQWKRAARH